MKGIPLAIVLGLIMWAVIIMCATRLYPATIVLPYCPVWPMKVMGAERAGISYWQEVQGGPITREVEDVKIHTTMQLS